MAIVIHIDRFRRRQLQALRKGPPLHVLDRTIMNPLPCLDKIMKTIAPGSPQRRTTHVLIDQLSTGRDPCARLLQKPLLRHWRNMMHDVYYADDIEST